MSLRRLMGAITVILLTSTTVAACGGNDGPSAHSGSSSSASPTGPTADPGATGTPEVEPAVPKDTALQQPKAEETLAPQATLSAVPGASREL